jgi:hypothetical protein
MDDAYGDENMIGDDICREIACHQNQLVDQVGCTAVKHPSPAIPLLISLGRKLPGRQPITVSDSPPKVPRRRAFALSQCRAVRHSQSGLHRFDGLNS